jgi:hypothetical protein
MARVAVTKTTPPGAYSGSSTVVTMENGNTGDGLYFAMTGGELLIIQNTNAGSQTWSATSVDDSFGRQEHITTESIAAGAIRVFGPIELAGWQQTNGQFYFTASSTDVKFGVISKR